MTTERSVFVARECELAQMNEFLDTTLAGQGQVCFVTGEAGSGKTALVTEFARRTEKVHPDLTSSESVIKLRLTHVEKMRGDVVWLRYEVIK